MHARAAERVDGPRPQSGSKAPITRRGTKTLSTYRQAGQVSALNHRSLYIHSVYVLDKRSTHCLVCHCRHSCCRNCSNPSHAVPLAFHLSCDKRFSGNHASQACHSIELQRVTSQNRSFPTQASDRSDRIPLAVGLHWPSPLSPSFSDCVGASVGAGVTA